MSLSDAARAILADVDAPGHTIRHIRAASVAALRDALRAHDAQQQKLSDDGRLLAAIAEPLDDAQAGAAARLAVGDLSGLYLDWLADELDRTTDPQRINTIRRVAGNVRALAGM